MKQATKKFDDKIIFEHFDLSINQSEIVVIMGESGAGKTTILRCLNLLETLDAGSIAVDGLPCYNQNMQLSAISIRKKIQKKVGIVFQNYNLFPHLNVLDNLIEAPIYYNDMTKKEATEKATKLLEKLRIEDKAKAYPYQLSGGQKQRVAIARACMLNPMLLCFDEPTAALDEESREGVIRIIQELAKDGMAIVIVSHDPVFARKVATRMVSLGQSSVGMN